MKGYVIESKEVIVPLILFGEDETSFEIDAALDTGANCELTLPPEALEVLNAEFLRDDQAAVAGDEIIECRVFAVTILWTAGQRTIEAFELDSIPLVGMKLLEGHRLTIDVVDGGTVSILPLHEVR